MKKLLEKISRATLYSSMGLLSLATVAGLVLPHATFADTLPTGTSGGASYNVMIMSHLCNSSIKDWNDFENMESGRNPITNIAEDVAACPTTGLVTSAPVAGSVAAPRSNYDFSVTSDNQTKTLSANGTFEPTKICESDVGLDLNGDGQISTSTCLDISDYNIPITTSSASSTILRVAETQAPEGYHFGTLRFTPVALDGNNDSEDLSYLNPETGQIDLNMVPDKDGMIMLHVYNFQNSGSNTGTTTGGANGSGTTTDTGSMGTTTDTGSTTGTGSTTSPTVNMIGGIYPTNGSARVGTSVDFGGANFGHEETVTIMMNGQTVGTAHADGGGNFSTGSLPIPSTPGTYTYTFLGQTSNIGGTGMLTVTQ